MEAFFLRTIALPFLVLAALRQFVVPGWAFYGMFAYVALGLMFSVRSPDVWWSLQHAGLLMVTTIALTLGLAQYLKTTENIRSLLRIFVVAGLVWSVASLQFISEYLTGKSLRFGGGETIHATNYAASGALLMPFMLWAAMQRGQWLWRLFGIAGMLIIPVCLFVSGTRAGIIVAAVASTPLLLQSGMSRTLHKDPSPCPRPSGGRRPISLRLPCPVA